MSMKGRRLLISETYNLPLLNISTPSFSVASSALQFTSDLIPTSTRHLDFSTLTLDPRTRFRVRREQEKFRHIVPHNNRRDIRLPPELRQDRDVEKVRRHDNHVNVNDGESNPDRGPTLTEPYLYRSAPK